MLLHGGMLLLSRGRKFETGEIQKNMHGLSGISRYVTVDGTDIHYVQAGQGSPVLLYHELVAAAFTRQDNITVLSQHYRAFVFDLLGHGESDKPDVDYYPWDVADIMCKAAVQLGISNAAVSSNR